MAFLRPQQAVHDLVHPAHGGGIRLLNAVWALTPNHPQKGSIRSRDPGPLEYTGKERWVLFPSGLSLF